MKKRRVLRRASSGEPVQLGKAEARQGVPRETARVTRAAAAKKEAAVAKMKATVAKKKTIASSSSKRYRTPSPSPPPANASTEVAFDFVPQPEEEEEGSGRGGGGRVSILPFVISVLSDRAAFLDLFSSLQGEGHTGSEGGEEG